MPTARPANLSADEKQAQIHVTASSSSPGTRPPDGIELGDLGVESRTFGAVEKLLDRGTLRRLSDLGRWTVGQLAAAPGIAAGSLLALLCALETSRKHAAPHAGRPADSSLEAELDGILRQALPARWVPLVARIWGWDGRGGCSERAVKAEVGLRASVHAVVKRAQTGLQAASHSDRTPILHKVIRLTARSAPALAADVEQVLAERGLAQKPFLLYGMFHAALSLGRKVPFALHENPVRMVLPAAWRARKTARKLRSTVRIRAANSVRHWGVARIKSLAQDLAVELGGGPLRRRLAEALVSALAPSVLGFSWLDRSGGWFWQRGQRNALLTHIRKTLVVTGPLELTELREALLRCRFLEGYVPPGDILLELCRQADDVDVSGTTVIPSGVAVSVLSPVERVLADVVREQGPLSGAALRNLCAERGIRRAQTVSHIASSMPSLVNLPNGLWVIRGADHTSVAKGACVRRGQKKGLLEYGWSQDGSAWLRIKLTPNMAEEGFFFIPRPLQHLLRGNYRLQPADGSGSATLRCAKGRGAGLTAWFRAQQAGAGRLLLLELEPQTRTMRASWDARAEAEPEFAKPRTA